jgi:hypothetical protein
LFGNPEAVAARIAKLIGANSDADPQTAPIDIPVAG